MKILKQGVRPTYSKEFTCKRCGCVFSAERNEYCASSQMEMMHDNLGSYKCKCPCCGDMVYQN